MMGYSGGDCVHQANMLSLPTEVLEHIWLQEVLDYRDVCHLASVCSKLRHISQSNEVWRFKFQRRWPTLFSHCVLDEGQHWLEEFQKRVAYGRATRSKVSSMSAEYFSQEEVPRSGFSDLNDGKHHHSPYFIIDELRSIIHDGQSALNLTEKYYAEKALRFVRQVQLDEEWRALLRKPPSNQSLERGAVLVAQWCQSTKSIKLDDVVERLDAIAKQVLAELKRRNSEHPAVKPSSLPLTSPDEELEESMWPPKQCRQILESLNHVLYTELNFVGNGQDYYNQDNTYINQVLEKRKGIPITLAIVYASVAKRLGVLCEPLNFPSHFLLKWLEHPGLPEGQAYTYIDAFYKGRFLSEHDCTNLLDIPISHELSRSTFEAITPDKVFARMARNLVNIGRQQGRMGDGLLCLRNAVELYLVICPEDMDSRILLARLYLHLHINLIEVMDILQGVSGADRNAPTGLIGYLTKTAQQNLEEQRQRPAIQPITAKPRIDKEVRFSVGLIMKHLRYHYLCVICGSDAKCEASQEWIVQMGVHNLPDKQFQPFYNVLVEDGSNRYAAQENLEVAAEPNVITHPEVGRFFKEFRGTHYLPNTEKLAEYPEDLSVTEQYVRDKHGI